MVVYLIQGIPWAAGGLVLGFVLAVAAARKGLIKGVVSVDQMSDREPDPHQIGTMSLSVEEKSALPWHKRSTFWVGLLVASIGVYTAITGVTLSNRTSALQACQQAYLVGFSDNLQAVRDASKTATDDLTKVISLVRSLRSAAPANAQAQFDQAVDDYLASRARADQAARDNPIRDPRDICKNL